MFLCSLSEDSTTDQFQTAEMTRDPATRTEGAHEGHAACTAKTNWLRDKVRCVLYAQTM